MKLFHLLALPLVVAPLASPASAQDVSGQSSAGNQRPTTPKTGLPIRFAVIGDFGQSGPDLAAVAALVKRFDPLFIITTGDNNYPSGQASTIDANIGQYFHEYIHPYTGIFGDGADGLRFFPSLGNHDWDTNSANAYLNYFELPGNERYYTFKRGSVEFFVVDGDGREPDGVTADSVQGQWFQGQLAASNATFKVVYMHEAPYSSGLHGNDLPLQWPYEAWGADLVLSGHDHDYERLSLGGFPYIVNGIGGRSLRDFEMYIAGSESQFNQQYGAMIVDADDDRMVLTALATDDTVLDVYTLTPEGLPIDEVVVLAPGATWKYLDDGSDQGTAWAGTGFDDTTWASGSAQLGYGDGDEATTVSFGPNANDKYVTTYFRHEFTVADPSIYDVLRLEILRDDGAVVHLNGTELFRSNMPAGTIDFETFAASTIGSGAEDSYFDFEIPAGAVLPGTNLLSVEIHQRTATSSDISFDLRIIGVQGTETLVAKGSDWSYLDDGSDQGTAWSASGFDDSGWAVGPAQLGYGEGDEATVVDFGGDPNDKHITTYFRHEFEVVDPDAYRGLLLRTLRDDGAVVFVNGVEVYKSNLPLDGVTSSTLAPYNLLSDDENRFIGTSIDPDVLVAGTNVVAVEIHQRSITSTDLSFDLELVGLP